MPGDADDDLASLREAAEAVILEAMRHNPERVLQVIGEVIDELEAECGYSMEEIAAAVEHVMDELGQRKAQGMN